MILSFETKENFVFDNNYLSIPITRLTCGVRSLRSVATSFCTSIVLRNSTTVSGSVEDSPSFAASRNAYLLGSLIIEAQGQATAPLCMIALWNNPVQDKLNLTKIFPIVSIFFFNFDQRRYGRHLDIEVYLQSCRGKFLAI